jgi:hypothetical protein
MERGRSLKVSVGSPLHCGGEGLGVGLLPGYDVYTTNLVNGGWAWI